MNFLCHIKFWKFGGNQEVFFFLEDLDVDVIHKAGLKYGASCLFWP